MSAQDGPPSWKFLGVAVRTPCCASVLPQAHVKFFTFSLSRCLRFGVNVWVLENEAPEKQTRVTRACRSEKLSYASVRCWLPKPVNVLFFRWLLLRPQAEILLLLNSLAKLPLI